MEIIIPAENYTFDASAKTITLFAPYSDITIEQVLKIRNLTCRQNLYDCNIGSPSISIESGIITHTASNKYHNDTDNIQISISNNALDGGGA